MPKCQSCDSQWGWLDTLKVGFINNKKCPICQKRQYVSPSAKKRQLLIYYFPFIFLVIASPLFNLSNTVSLSIGFLFILIIIATSPYTIKLSNEQKPLW